MLPVPNRGANKGKEDQEMQNTRKINTINKEKSTTAYGSAANVVWTRVAGSRMFGSQI
jgi:hypothetical protein